MEKSNLKIKGHIGTWYVIDESHYKGKKVFLLESENFGDDAPCLIIDNDCNLIMQDVFNGFDELYY